MSLRHRLMDGQDVVNRSPENHLSSRHDQSPFRAGRWVGSAGPSSPRIDPSCERLIVPLRGLFASGQPCRSAPPTFQPLLILHGPSQTDILGTAPSRLAQHAGSILRSRPVIDPNAGLTSPARRGPDVVRRERRSLSVRDSPNRV